ncbi:MULTISPECIES: hypothetical protein [Bacillus cereus group]|uniref:Uncharacterized protein n=1 Tax=Bacillus cereus (strain G9842) TaxID=405531 RepID=B7IZJ7_BACC2|nr:MULTISPECIES: hypothetical protein [Bacillus cereus group]MBS9807085.1 hypothetical protein [Bacillus toyonensis]ACK98766.1 hypothetical protein BCG9842_A0004 [Bacillus cereus G9842]MDR4135840.1 hypothetical protein [Bacillus cereus]MDR4363553.1 hypothetical protein [Bacillus cereus]PEC95163.1 hypothetical protein CON17_19880 [Bacillus thuringiensis]
MSFFFGYVDVNNDLYVTTDQSTAHMSHGFPVGKWTKAASNVKTAVISNEDYDYACDGYIDMNGNLYAWRTSMTPTLVDTNVKQADSSEGGRLAYVKNDNTLWMVATDSSFQKGQIATNVDYVVYANFQLAYRSLDGNGYFTTRSSPMDFSKSFYSVGAVKSIAAGGANSGQARFFYVGNNGDLYANPAGSTSYSFTKIASNVMAVKKAGYSDYFYITNDNTLYAVSTSNTHTVIARNVADWWSNLGYSSGLLAVFYTLLDSPTVLRTLNEGSSFQAYARTTPTPIKKMGSSYGALSYTRVEISTSDDGVTFSQYIAFNPSFLPQKRFLKFRAIIDGGTQTGERKVFEFDQTSPATKLVLNEFLSTASSDVKVNGIHKIDGIQNDTFTDGKLFEVPIDRTKYKSITKIEVV